MSASLSGMQSVAKARTNQAASEQLISLTRRLHAGDEEAFREFHEAYFDRLYQFLLVVTRGGEHEAREALQDTLLRVARYVRVFESEETFWCWLKAVARSAARDGARKRRRYLAVLQNFALAFGKSPDEPPIKEDGFLHALLEESLEELTPADRRLIESKYFGGSAVRDLAADTGLTEKAVESRLVRLRRGLRERILKRLRHPGTL